MSRVVYYIATRPFSSDFFSLLDDDFGVAHSLVTFLEKNMGSKYYCKYFEILHNLKYPCSALTQV